MTISPSLSLVPAVQSTKGGSLISVRGLSHRFGEGPTAQQVLFDVSFDVHAGEIVLLMGPSGCGKTTVLTLVGALRSVQQGSVHTLGRTLNGADEAVRTAVRREIGFIFQSHNLHASLTARQNVRMGLEVHGPAALGEWRPRTDQALDEVGLQRWAEVKPGKLSGGQKLRVAIARALVSKPRLILADEPTAALDRSTGRQVVDLLQDLAKRRGGAILMVTHDARIADIADRIVEMEDGRIVASTSSRLEP